jgi:hypothetical protein
MPFVFANLRRFAREINTTDSGGYTLSQLEFNKRKSSSNVSGCRSIVPLSRFGLKNEPTVTSVKRKHSISTAPGE